MKKTPLVIGSLILMTGLALAYNKSLETATSRSDCIDMTDTLFEGCSQTCDDLGAKYGDRTWFLCQNQCGSDQMDNTLYCIEHFPK